MKRILYGVGILFAAIVGLGAIGAQYAPLPDVAATASPEVRTVASSAPSQAPTIIPVAAPVSTPSATPLPTKAPTPVSTKTPPPKPSASTSSCDPNYSGACVPIASDVDCAGGSGNGPAYVRGPVRVIGRDIYDLDRDGNGAGCE